MNHILARLEAADARKAAKQAAANLPAPPRIRKIIPILAQVFEKEELRILISLRRILISLRPAWISLCGVWELLCRIWESLCRPGNGAEPRKEGAPHFSST
jgi:hypothetical protein